MFYIYLKLNERGKMICDTDIRVLEYNSTERPNDEQVQNFICTNFMPQFVESIIEVRSDWSWISVGTVLKIIYPKSHTSAIAEVDRIYRKNDGTIDEFIIKTNNYGGNSYERRINAKGLMIGSRGTNRPYVTEASEEEIRKYTEEKNINESYNHIFEMLEARSEWEESDEIPMYLTAEVIAKVRDILDNAYAEYYADK